MTKHRFDLAFLLLALAGVAACARGSASPRTVAAAPVSGGTIVASVRAEPKSFNHYNTRDLTGEVISRLTQAALVRVNRVTHELEPELAETWTLLPDGVTYRIALRRDLRFADGHPFSADDVAFSFRALYDTPGGVVLADTLYPGGKRLALTVEDAHTVTIRFAAPFGPGLRLLDGIPMLPKHRLEAAWAAGKFASSWTLSTPPSEVTGLGPFALSEYVPGQRLVFDRNPHYWRRDAAGHPLPSVDRVILQVVTDQSAEQLLMTAGEIDFTQSEVRPADYASLKQAAAQGRLTLTDLGVGMDGDLLWFNLAPSAHHDPRHAWLQHADFRRAVSAAVDRQQFVDTVYFGAAAPAFGVVSPANREWYAGVSDPAYDPAAADRWLSSLGLTLTSGQRLDAAGRPVRFTLLTQAGNSSLERGAAAIRESLARVGVRVDVVTLDVSALVAKFTSGDYDAAYFRLLTTDTDPSLNSDFWLSSGDAHVWAPAQKSPRTSWERDIDDRVAGITASSDPAERRRLFADVQRIMAREVPVLCFAFPQLWVATSTRVMHATPAAYRPPILWNPEVIAVSTRPESTRGAGAP
jgi:peptide/nickel transport system substrate-binding protein